MQELLDTITLFADRAHDQQMRKYTSERYIVHPVRVMETCRKYKDDLTMLAAALLHDVLEDTPITKVEMKSFLETLVSPKDAERTLALVVELTDVYIKKDYPNINRRSRKAKELERMAKTLADSQTIKYADIIDNTKEIVKNNPSFARVYLHECRSILKALDKGHPTLYQEAVDIVNAGIDELNKRN